MDRLTGKHRNGFVADGRVAVAGDAGGLRSAVRAREAGGAAGPARVEALPPRYEVVALLRERHDALAARRDAHIKQLGARRDTANDAVEAARKAAQ